MDKVKGIWSKMATWQRVVVTAAALAVIVGVAIGEDPADQSPVATDEPVQEGTHEPEPEDEPGDPHGELDDTDEPGEPTEPRTEEEPEELDEQRSVTGEAITGPGFSRDQICRFYVGEVVIPAVEGEADEFIREGLDDVLYDASFLEDDAANRLLYGDLEKLAEAWDAGDDQWIEEASRKLTSLCEMVLEDQ